MITRIIIAAAITLFFTPTSALFSQEHPEHPEHPKAGGAQKKVSTADISAGIKKNITADTNKSDGKFHVKYEGQDLDLDLIKVHDDRLQDLGDGNILPVIPLQLRFRRWLEDCKHWYFLRAAMHLHSMLAT